MQLIVKGVSNTPKLVDVETMNYQIGFTSDFQIWFNVVSKDVKELVKLKETILKKGNTVEFNVIEHESFTEATDLKVISESRNEPSGESIDFEALLDAAHKKADKDGTHISIDTEVLTDGAGNPLIDYENQHALFNATISVFKIDADNERILLSTFTAHGDSCGIDSIKVKDAFVRMAETRAIARALRWYTNNALVATEEKSE